VFFKLLLIVKFSVQLSANNIFMKFFLSVSFFLIAHLCYGQKAKLTLKAGHGASVEFQKLSEDNRYMISTDVNKVAILWDVASGNQVGKFENVMVADFASDSKTLYLVNENGETSQFDLLGRLITKMPSFTDKLSGYEVVHYLNARDNILLRGPRIQRINNGAISYTSTELEKLGDRRTYAAVINKVAAYQGSQGGNILLFDANTGNEEKKIPIGLTESGLDIAFSADASLILAADKKSVKIVEVQTGKIIRTYTGTTQLYGAALSADGKSFVVLSDKKLTMMETLTGKKIWEVDHGIGMNDYGKGPHVNFSADGTKLLYGGGYFKTMILASASNGKTEQRFEGASSREINELFIDAGNNKLMSKTDDSYAITWDLTNGFMQKPFSLKVNYVKNFLAVKEDRIFLYGGNNENLREINAKGEEKSSYPALKYPQNPGIIKASKEGDYVVASAYSTSSEGCNNGFTVYDTKTGKMLWQKMCDKYEGVSVSQYSSKLAAAKNTDKEGGGGKIHLYNLVTGDFIDEIISSNLPYTPDYLLFSPHDKYLFAQNNSIIEVFELPSKRSILIGKTMPDGSNASTVNFSSDDRYLYIATFKGNVYYYDLISQQYEGQPIKPSSGYVRGINYVNEGKYLFCSATDNTITVWDSKQKKLLATLYSNAATGDWAVVTPDGRFDASPAFQQNIYYQKGLEIIPLKYVYEKFYTPKLLPRILAGESFEPIPDIDIKPKPKTKIMYAETQRNLEIGDDITTYKNTTGVAAITINATAPQDKVDEIRLFHNGKVVNLATRNLFVTDNDGSESKKYTINLLPGNNSFRAIALNSQRTESDADEIVVSYSANGNQPAPPPPPPPNNNNMAIISPVDKNATMYLMVIGINAYTNKINPLTYALPDATAFKEEIEKDAKSVLANVKTYFITDAKADNAGIINAFNEIKRDAKPQDVFVFYYAGHGYINPTNKEFYLVSADVTDGGESLMKNGVPAKELQQYAIDIQAQKQLFILDACQSAGAFDAMLKHDGEQQKSLAVVARSTGTHWMAASGSTETAKEFGQLGHGAFTYVLLQALKGQAASNKMITVNGMKNYLQINVPELVKKYGSNNQYPASYGFGNDFPVEIMK
jgi:WD40 repeat protein